MRQIKIICVGKIKQSARYLSEGIQLYEKRLSHAFQITWVEVAEEAPTPTRPVAQILEKEADGICAHIQTACEVILLNEKGKLMSSEAFAQWLFERNPPNGGRSKERYAPMIFIVGGAYGTAERLTAKADHVISLSPMTFVHQMVRLILMEQLYRAHTIYRQEPYHK